MHALLRGSGGHRKADLQELREPLKTCQKHIKNAY
jgi:hypothetical protein